MPYSVLAFRLEKGEDEKKYLAVRLKGEFIRSARYQNVNVKVNCGALLASSIPNDQNLSFFSTRRFDACQRTPQIP